MRPCYCPACRARFEREKHLPPPHKNSDPGWDAYQEMQRQVFREFIDQTLAEVHKLDPQCLVGINNAYHLMMPEKPPPGVGYLTSDIGNQVEALSPLAHWLDSQGVPFDLMTKLGVADPRSIQDGVPASVMPKPAGQIQQEMAVILANGGRYSLWDIPTPEGRLRPEWIAAIARDVTPFLRARQPWCLGTRLPDVAVLHSAAAHYAATNRSEKTLVSQDIHVGGVMSALAPRHLNYELIPDWRLAAQDIRSPLLLVEDPELVTDELAARVLRFLEDGGRVLWSGQGLSARLQAAFGVKIAASTAEPEKLQLVAAQPAMQFDRRLFRLECHGAQVRLPVQTADGKRLPLLTSRDVGRGQAFYAAIPLMSRYAKQTVPAELVDQVLHLVLPAAGRRLLTDAPPSVECVVREKNGQQVVHLVNRAEGRRKTVAYHSVVLYPGVTKDGQRGIHPDRIITDIPPAPKCHLSLQLERRPASVTLQPQNHALSD